MIENIERFFASGISVLRNDPDDNKIGGKIDNWELHLEIDGIIRPLSGNEAVSGDKLTLIATHTLYCGVHDILETDRIRDAAGNEYDIKFVQNPMNMNNHLQISMEIRR